MTHYPPRWNEISLNIIKLISDLTYGFGPVTANPPIKVIFNLQAIPLPSCCTRKQKEGKVYLLRFVFSDG